MDQMGEVDYAPGEPKGTPWHPHRGFETVTYMIDGTFAHQDSHGGGGLITDGATQWMTAGKGILHIETPPEELVVAGGRFHGIQLWVNLPARDKMIEPAYQGLEAATSPCCRPVTAARWCGSSPATSPATAAPGRPIRRWPSCTRRWHRGRCSSFRGTPVQRAASTSSPDPDGWGSDGRPVTSGQLVMFGAGDFISLGPTTRRIPAPATSRP